MRWLLALPVALAVTVLAQADEADDLKDRVLKAAAKDPANLQKFRMFVMKAKGTASPRGKDEPASLEFLAVYPGKLKATWEFAGDSSKYFHTICARDDVAWRQASNVPVTELSVDEVNDFRSDVYAVFSSTLLTLTEPETKVSPGGRAKVGGDPVVGLKLSRRPFRDVTLYFDERTHLLRKMSYHSREGGVVSSKDMLYGGHKEIAGLTVPTTQTTFVDGKKVYNWTEMTFEFPDKLDVQTFEKP